jgi:hypothetical protein
MAYIFLLVPDRSAEGSLTSLRLLALCHKETHMLNTVITQYIAPSLPSRIDVELRIRIKR